MYVHSKTVPSYSGSKVIVRTDRQTGRHIHTDLGVAYMLPAYAEWQKWYSNQKCKHSARKRQVT